MHYLFISVLLIVVSLTFGCDVATEEAVFLVTFDYGGNGENQTVETSGVLSEPQVSDTEHYTFSGWYSDESLSDEWDFEQDRVRGDMTLIAGWIADTYAITFHANGADGGDIPPAQTKVYGEELILSGNTGVLTLDGFEFNGWNTASDGNGTHYDAGGSYTVNAEDVLYAEWKSTLIKFLSPDTCEDEYDDYGYAIDIDGGVAAVSTYGDRGDDFGKVYIYELENGTWSRKQTLLPSDQTENTGIQRIRFGYSLALSSDTLMVGAPKGLRKDNDDNDVTDGAVYVYYRDAGTGLWGDASTSFDYRIEHEKLTAESFRSTNSHFGCAVSFDGDTAVIGAIWGDTGVSDVGLAFTFNKDSTWTLKQVMGPSDGAYGDQFGYSTAIDGDLLCIGAMLADVDSTTDAGAVYTYEKNSSNFWEFKEKITDSAAKNLGHSIAIEGDTAVIGSATDLYGRSSGLASVYSCEGASWTFDQYLLPSGGEATDWFGYSVDIDGDRIAVGSERYHADGLIDSGGVFVYTHHEASDSWGAQETTVNGVTGYTENRLVSAIDGSVSNFFGKAVALDGDTLFVSAPNDRTQLLPPGSVYMYTLE